MPKKRYILSDPTANTALANVERERRAGGGRPSRDLLARLDTAVARLAAGDDVEKASQAAGVSIDYVRALAPGRRVA